MNYRSYSPEELAADEQFQAYVLAGKDHEFWERWQQTYPEKYAGLQQARQLVLLLKASQASVNQRAAGGNYHAIRKKLQAASSAPAPRHRTLPRLWWQAAASVAVVLAAVSGWWLWQSFSLQTADMETHATVIEKTTPAGQKSTIKLGDGTVVKLNSGSTLRLPAEFGAERVVELQGEAFFEVAHDPRRPFIVKTSNIHTKVLGTSFNVKAYKEDPVVAVAVVTGKVQVQQLPVNDAGLRQAVTETILQSSEMVVAPVSGKGMVKSAFNPDRVLAWKEGRLYLENETFEQVLLKLEKWYGVEILTSDTLSVTEKYTGSFKDESLENVLEALKVSGSFNYRINNKEVYLY